MLRLIVRIGNGNTFKTYDFECHKLENEYRNGDIIGLEILHAGPPRLIDFDTTRKIATIKAIRTYTGMGLKEAKEFVESVPAYIPDVDPSALNQLISDLRDVGAVVEV